MRNKKAYCGISIFILLVLTAVCTSGVYAKETSVVAFDVNQTNIEEITQKIVSQGPRPTSFSHSASKEEMEKGEQATQQAVEYIKSTMEEYGLETSVEELDKDPSYNMPFTIYNIIGVKHGTNLNDQIIIVCSHYDTTLGSPGADDNAIGVAATLEIARLLKDHELNRTIYFIVFHHGLGPERWIGMHPDLRGNIIGVIGLDQIGYGDRLRILYIPQSSWLADLVQRSGNDLHISINRQLYFDPSNQGPFSSINIPAVMLTESIFTPYQHKPGDTIETLNFSLAEDATKTAIESIYRLATPKDTDPPVVKILRPKNTSICGINTVPLTYNISEDDTHVQVFLGGENLGNIKSGHWLILTRGQHDIEVWATDECGNTGRDVASFEVDVYVLNVLNSDAKSNTSLKILVIGLFVVLLMVMIIIRYKRNNKEL